MKKERILLMAFAVSISFCAKAQIPDGYYREADGKNGAELKSALYDVIGNHKVLSYSDLWAAYETTDVVPGTYDQVYDLFSTKENYYSTSAHGADFNREHVVPQSWWGGGNLSNAYSDVFNVLPSESAANTAKSNYPLGKITGAVIYDNGRMRVGKSSESGGAPYVFEPYDEFKGDFARIYMYVATCYKKNSWTQTNYSFLPGVSEYPTLQSWIIPLLLQWNRLDPVSEREIERQEAVYGIQYNRNPFVDYPILAEYVWGDSVAVDFDLETAVPHLSAPYTGEGGNEGGDNPPADDSGIDNLIFCETFDDLGSGNDYASNGSSVEWNGNDNIVAVSAVYCAGNAVKLGTAKKTGLMTTKPIEYDGGRLRVEVDVKGWTSIEGDVSVTVSGAEEQVYDYSSTMNDAYETASLVFTGVAGNPSVTVATTAKRCFIGALRVYGESEADAVSVVRKDKVADDEAYYTLSGQRLNSKPQQRGIYIHCGKKIVVR
ncbi:MAG: endonuclease [Bacteroides sp.]|nr:endonuclease [Roseburia sp.]MCM1345469.1 endonuclease [Bacteroides sp.]MCM1419979.1 endonuclease [Bacteroides sp.]